MGSSPTRRPPGQEAADRLLVVVAHPDDETFGCGSLLLHARACGYDTAVCCATRGEAGDPAPGSGVRRGELGTVREAELRAAASVLGVGTVELLDHRDSGMDGPAGPGALVAAPLEDVVADVLDVIERLRPRVVVTLAGDDGHRDHVRMREATLAAVERAAWSVERVYLQCLSRALLREWAAYERARDPDSPYLDVDGAGIGTAEEDLTDVIDSRAHLPQRRAAIACHRSQRSPFEGLPATLAEAFLTKEHLVRLRPASSGGHVEGFFAAAGSSR